MNLRNKYVAIILCGVSLFISCEDYLDIVPDGTQELSLLFNRKETAYNALANCYSYLPQNDGTYASYVLLSDELAVPIPKEPNSIKLMSKKGIRVSKELAIPALSTLTRISLAK